MALADGYAELDAHIAGLYSGKIIAEEDVRRMCEKAKEILKAESNVVSVRAPITIVRATGAHGRTRRPPRPPQRGFRSCGRVSRRVCRRLATSMASSRTCWS
jgi:hypothetical protein